MLSVKRTNSNQEQGFTLIELLVVIIIVGILAAIAIPIFVNQQKQSIIASVRSDVLNTNKNIVTALTKLPTATFLDTWFQGGGTTGEPGTYLATNAVSGSAFQAGEYTKAVEYKTVISDSNTTISIAGGWDSYIILGTNTSIGETAKATGSPSDPTLTGGFGILYVSNTGKTVEVGT